MGIMECRERRKEDLVWRVCWDLSSIDNLANILQVTQGTEQFPNYQKEKTTTAKNTPISLSVPPLNKSAICEDHSISV